MTPRNCHQKWEIINARVQEPLDTPACTRSALHRAGRRGNFKVLESERKWSGN